MEDKIKDPSEEVESSPVGFLLPGDEDELLAGLMDDFDLSGLPSQLEDMEDDFFGSGGLEMESEDQNNLLNGFTNLSMYDGIPGSNSGHFSVPNGAATVVGEHPYGEHPSRTLFVRNINSNVEDSELKSLFEVMLNLPYSLNSSLFICYPFYCVSFIAVEMLVHSVCARNIFFRMISYA